MKYLTSSINIFILLVIISFTLDNVLSPCSMPSLMTFINNFVHHIISMYLWFGSLLFGKYIYHLLFICMIFVIHYFYGSKCPITIEYNRECGFELKGNHKDLIYWINKNIFSHFPYYTILKLLIVYDIYKILLHYK